MKRFDKILRDIKSIKIQGATNVATKGIEAFLISPTKESAKKILLTRPTEPFLQNSIKFLLNSKNPKKDSEIFLKKIKLSNEKLAKSGEKLVKNNMKIFTHCHSSSVLSILKLAKKKGKKFEVFNTETRPLLQGRKTAKELAKLKIKVTYLPDLAAEDALKQCDLFLFGADAYTKSKIVNKTGTNMLCKIAKIHKVPRYSCGISLKFTNKFKIEKRSGKELWNENEKYIKIFNPAFSAMSSKYLTGIVSEFGVLPYKKFIKLAREKLGKLN